MEEPIGRNVIVVGAGIVGVCCALYLQRQGLTVTMIDRGGPGEGCSAGNAGQFGIDTCVPFSVPGIVGKLPRMLLDPREPLKIRWGCLPQAIPYFLRYIRAGTARRVEAIAAARACLLDHVVDSYDTLLNAAGARDLVRWTGRLVAYESTRSLDKVRFGTELRRRHGVCLEELDGDQCRKIEPALGTAVRCGIYFPEAGHTVNPLRLTQVLAEGFVRDGGHFLRETVASVQVAADGSVRVVTDATARRADKLVIAAGYGSRVLANQLGSKVPMEAERGYHTMLPNPGVALGTPLTLGDRGVAVAPMENGLRLSGIAEFAGPEAPPDYGLADLVLTHAMAVIPGLCAEGAARWMGCRPSTPDFLPVIGPVPHHASVFFAFGHGHTGLTLAAITGSLIGEMVVGRPTTVDVTPFRPDRF